ncbi:MAG TPA: condensation domain-containing protein, partial [Candidatus Deferrimicrobium sp.]|nr:condensation domain-containing protein [Candidatus Deferrimicrobium sp.]
AGQCFPGEKNGAEKEPGIFLPSLRKGKHACEQILTSLSRLYLRGVDIDWNEFYKQMGMGLQKVTLPNYPFQRARYWHNLIPTANAVLYQGPQSPQMPQEMKSNQTKGAILPTLKEMIQTVSGLDPEGIENDADLISLGLDSLMLVELRRKINKQYGVDISLNEFFMELNSVTKIAGQIKIKGKLQEEPVSSFSQSTVAQSLSKVKAGNYFPMTSAQKRMYALSQTQEGDRAYHTSYAMKVAGKLDVEKIENIFKILIRRHDVFRTGLEIIDGELLQHVYPLEEIKFSIVYEKNSGADIEALLNEMLRPFELAKPPLLRVSITEISSVLFIFIMNFHHSVMDGASLTILVQEIMQLYRGEELLPLKVQYREYAQWEEQYRQSPDFESHGQYWLDQLSGDLPVLELPIDFSRPEALDFEGETLKFKIEKEKATKIKELARATHTSLNMLLLAILNVWLFKLTGQEDIAAAIPAMVKTDDFRDSIGMFTNTLVLRNQPGGEKTFTRFLEEVKISCLQAYMNREYPYEALVEKLGNPGGAGRNPLFDVIFGYENGNERMFKLPGLTFSTIHLGPGATPFDLFLSIIEEEGYFNAMINYRTRLFKKESVERWKRYYERLLEEISKDPGQCLSRIEILSEEEKQEILEGFNDTAADFPRDKTIAQLFEDQVEQAPDRIAVVGAGPRVCPLSLTYRQLNGQANRLAGLLIEKGVEPDTIVAIMMERSIDLITGLWGILKAGGAYLPIDPSYPQERIDYMLKDSGAALLVTNDVFSSSFPTSYLPNFQTSRSSNLAYLIYTSGSTGKPKGTLTSHANVIRVVRNTNYIEITNNDRILQLSNYAFDGSVFDIYGALLNGAVLILVDRETTAMATRLGALINREQVTVFFVTTALFNTLVDLEISCLRNIRKVLFGGEKISLGHSAKALAALGKGRIIHMYGPTETTVYATYYYIDHIN